MRKRLTLLLSVAVLGVGTAAPTASADSYRVAQDEETTDDDDGTDYGWIGLLGLAGLAGLLGRQRNDRDIRDRDRVTTTRDR